MDTGPTRPLSFRESAIYGCGALGANAVYSFLNLAGGLYLERYPAVPTWLVGLLSQERSLAGAFVQPIVGAASDRTRTRIGRRKPFFIAGVALTAASLLYLSGFPPLVPMLIVLAINAFFLNVAVDPYTALMADIVPPGQRGRVGTVLAIFNMLGQIGATLLGLFLWDSSPQLVFVFTVVILVVAFTITTIGVHEPASPPAPTEPVKLDVRGYVRGLLAHRELAKYVGAAAVFWLGTGGVLPYLTRFGVHELGTSEGESFQLFLPALVGTIIGAIPAGFAADRIGKKQVIAAGLVAFSLIALIGSQVRTVPEALVVMGFIGLANGIWTALNVPLLVDLVPPERAAEITGLGSGVWSLAQPVGAVFAGILIGGFASYRASFIGASALVFVSFLLLLTVRAPRVAHVA
ncbi:MAG TPA: MFS transporter [Candidatus Limnocylindria bacterium]|jgi:Na+/melibiose symporter-like transporter|nr:MFS transporter [Candidatus Limnocylindria bacterium]